MRTDRQRGIPVGERALHLDFVQQAGYTGEYVSSAEECLPVLHELRDRVLAVADALLQL